MDHTYTKASKMKKQKAAVLFSGGKDSCLALHLAKQEGYEISYLLSVIPKNPDSFMFHKPDLKLLERQAEMLDIDLVVMESKGRKEEEVEDLRKMIRKVKKDVEVIVAGGIASSYQAKRIKKICKEEGLEFYAPLWNLRGGEVWGELLRRGFKVILTKISCEGLGKEWIGKIIDKKRFKELERLSERYKFRIDFEGGEAETAVLYMPEFKKLINTDYKIKEEGRYRSFLEISKAK